jgi:hypothetical protein
MTESGDLLGSIVWARLEIVCGFSYGQTRYAFMNIKSLEDHEGNLIVTFHNAPDYASKKALEDAWASDMCNEPRETVSFEVVG